MLIYFLPVIAALIGWLTNYIAVKMLFHPRLEKKFLILRIQGVFPKRQKALALKLGDMVANELFSIEDVKSRLKEESSGEEIMEALAGKIDEFIEEKLPTAIPMAAMFMNSTMVDAIKKPLIESLESAIPTIIDKIGDHIEEAVDMREIVREKVEAFSSDKLESILFGIMKKEFKFIELVGGVLGFMIGIFQVLILQI